MRIALVAPPFISVPPAGYGGTELFLAHLVHGLYERGYDVILYANGESRVPCQLKWRYRRSQWPLVDPIAAQLKNADHAAWAVRDAIEWADLIHLNDAVGVPLTQFADQPTVHTLHHPHEPLLSEQYARYPNIQYVAISAFQARREPMPKIAVVHHGIRTDRYEVREKKDDYVAFLGRMAPCKGPHLAIEAARRAGIRVKLAGEIQPVFRAYFDEQVAPHIDGRNVEYVGEADHALKNDLLSHARALLFPIQWDEPFGLVMIEAMACGTPVLAFAGGSVAEIVRDGLNGWICRDTVDMCERMQAEPIPAASCRAYAVEHFSCDRMVEGYIDVYERSVVRHAASLNVAV